MTAYLSATRDDSSPSYTLFQFDYLVVYFSNVSTLVLSSGPKCNLRSTFPERASGKELGVRAHVDAYGFLEISMTNATLDVFESDFSGCAPPAWTDPSCWMGSVREATFVCSDSSSFTVKSDGSIFRRNAASYTTGFSPQMSLSRDVLRSL